MSQCHRHMSKKPVKQEQAKRICKVCKDAGKTEAEFTSHWLRDKPGADGVVICPTLLSNECRYCHETGHFPSTCPKLAANKKAQSNRERTQRVAAANMKHEHEKKPVARGANYGKFSGLMDDDYESDSEPVKRSYLRDDEYPVLSSHSIDQKAMPLNSYLSAASKQIQVECAVSAPIAQMMTKPTLNRQKTNVLVVPERELVFDANLDDLLETQPPPRMMTSYKRRSWADDDEWESSDDDNE